MLPPVTGGFWTLVTLALVACCLVLFEGGSVDSLLDPACGSGGSGGLVSNSNTSEYSGNWRSLSSSVVRYALNIITNGKGPGSAGVTKIHDKKFAHN